jgi:5,5'-dehydrodivanillate O-demethylase oxygenase subunit
MLTAEENRRLTEVGPRTAMGNLLRRYWYPVATTTQLDAQPVLRVRLLGEDLVLYRDKSGQLGLLAERCPHRGMSLAYGIPQDAGLRCALHSWQFDAAGRCHNLPSEADYALYDELRIPAYPVQELGGLVWAYLGPAPAPLLPRYDLLVREDLDREIGIAMLPCNWLQVMENTLDPVHAEHLHGHHANYVLCRKAKPPMPVRRHLRIAFDAFELGILKRRLLEGQDEACDDWRVGHAMVFPNILSVGTSAQAQFQFRVPVDDTTTLHVWYLTHAREDSPPQERVELSEFLYRHPDGSLAIDTAMGQDIMAWLTAGPIADRSTEHLGTSDQGIVLYRRLLHEQIERVEQGEDPMGVVREEGRNRPFIAVPRERATEYVRPGFLPVSGPDFPFTLRQPWSGRIPGDVRRAS